MTSFVVMERRPVAGARPETEFVRDGFSLVALVFPLIWLLWHRLWFAAVMLVLVSMILGLTGEYVAPGSAIALASLAVSLFVALEGPAWRLARLRRIGFADVGAIVAPNLEEAELRWFTQRTAPSRTAAPASVPVLARNTRTPPPLPQTDMLLGFSGEGSR